MVAYTANYNLAKPAVSGDSDVWGGYLNGNPDILDVLLKQDGTGTSIGWHIGTGNKGIIDSGATFTVNATHTFAKSPNEGYSAISASAIDLSAGRCFSKTISGTTTFTISNAPSSGVFCAFIIELTNGGSQTVNWPSSFKWPGGVAPTLTSSGVDTIAVYTRDGGTIYRAALSSADSR